MNEPFVAALDNALADDAALQGFGLEKEVIAYPSWDDRLTLDGAGMATVTSCRPAVDGGGVPIGLFRNKLSKEKLKAILQAFKKILVGPPLPSARVEPADARLVLSSVAGGQLFSYTTGTTPEQLQPLDGLMLLLNQAEMAAYQKPVRAAIATLKPVIRPKPGKPLVVQIGLSNPGTEGVWVSNPAAVSNDSDGEKVQLAYVAVPKPTPGPPPIRTPPSYALLHRVRDTPPAPPYLWLPPGNKEQVVSLQADDVTLGKGDWAFRAELYLDKGPEMVGGRPRLRGSLFTPDLVSPAE